MPDNKIVRAAIHPGIGIARVGNSEHEFFVGPEVPRPAPRPPGFYKDASGALKRQAAKFRVFGYNAAGDVVAELNADNARIRWTVHVANRKSAWYNFELTLDIPGQFHASAAMRTLLGPIASSSRSTRDLARSRVRSSTALRNISSIPESSVEKMSTSANCRPTRKATCFFSADTAFPALHFPTIRPRASATTTAGTTTSPTDP